MNSIMEHIVDIGIDVVKDKIKGPIMEAEARKRLIKFLDRQHAYNFNCTQQEEIDFEGLANYIQQDLIEDVKIRLFGDREERGAAYRTIISKAVHYAQAKTKLSEQRAKKMVNIAINLLREYYKSKANQELAFFAGRIEDTIIGEMDNHHEELSQQIQNISKQLSSTAILSLDHNISLATTGQFDEISQNLSVFMDSINSVHPLKPYYGFEYKGRGDGLVSVPLSEEATAKYPPQISVTASSVHIDTKDISELQNNDIWGYSYRHQLPITLDVMTASKLLGNTLDPVQTEAKKLQGKQVVLMPPRFPNAFPCSISMNDEIVFDYILMQTKEILEDGTILATNETQPQRQFDITFSINLSSKKCNFNIHPLAPSNADHLKYRKFIRNASKGGAVSIKSLALNTLLACGNIEPFSPSEVLDAEINFLERVTAIEQYFHIKLIIPQKISVDDHRLIHHIYSIIHNGSFSEHWSDFSIELSISDRLKQEIAKMENTTYMYAYNCTVDVELFEQHFSFLMKREIRSAKFKDIKRVKQKIEVLDIGDSLKIDFVPDETDGANLYIDTLAQKDE
jgi:hypothetical protein